MKLLGSFSLIPVTAFQLLDNDPTLNILENVE